MRVLLIVMALAFAIGAPVATAEEAAAPTTSADTEPTASSSATGPEPTSCRPYCIAS